MFLRIFVELHNMAVSKLGGEFLPFFSKTKSDSKLLLFAEENPLVGQSYSKRNFAETIFLFEISTFFVSSTPSKEFHYFYDHIQTEMIKNLFLEGHEEKTFFA